MKQPLKEHAVAYSEADAKVADFCDRVAKNLVVDAMKTPSIRRFIPKCLDNEFTLDVADFLYRPVHRFYALYQAIGQLEAGLPLFFCANASDLPYVLADEGNHDVFLLNPSKRVSADDVLENWSKQAESHPDMKMTLLELCKVLRGEIRAVLPEVEPGTDNNVYMAVNTNVSSYRVANKLIYDHLKNDYRMSVVDIVPPNRLVASPDGGGAGMYSALVSADRVKNKAISAPVAAAVVRALKSETFDDISVIQLHTSLSRTLERRVSALIALNMLYREILDDLRKLENAICVLVPGRQAALRFIARAFQTHKFETLDVQVLFISEMSRYKPPMADTFAVIDTMAQGHYKEFYDIPSSKTKMIGVINLDHDIVQAQNLGRVEGYKGMFSNPGGKVLTYAVQPGAEKDLIDAVTALAEYVRDRPELRLCVKMHPGQSELLQIKFSNLLVNIFGEGNEGNWCVWRSEPFWAAMAGTDFLVSLFSNVCLMAPAFDVPVFTLPSTGYTPKTDLASVGLAQRIPSLTQVAEIMDPFVNGTAKKTKTSPPHKYVSKNQHMKTPETLDRLAVVIADLLN